MLKKMYFYDPRLDENKNKLFILEATLSYIKITETSESFSGSIFD